MEKPGDASNVLIYSRIVSWNSVKNTIRKMSLHVILKKKKKKPCTKIKDRLQHSRDFLCTTTIHKKAHLFAYLPLQPSVYICNQVVVGTVVI